MKLSKSQKFVYILFYALLMPFSAHAYLDENLSAKLDEAYLFESEGDFDAALSAYSQLLDETTANNGEYAMELVDILIGLGRNYSVLGSPDLAEAALERAQHIVHRNEGVYSPGQFEILEIRTRIALENNQPLVADKQQRFLFYLGSRHFDGLDALPAYLKLSRWYLDTGQYHRARSTLKKAINLIQENDGEFSLLQLEPLRLVAETRRLQGNCCGEKSLGKALDVLNQNDVAPADIQAKIYLELADAYGFRGKSEKAAELYSKAQALGLGNGDRAPELLIMSNRLDSLRRTQMRIYQVETDPFHSSYRQITRKSDEEMLLADHQPPQFFVAASSESRFGVKIKDALQVASSTEKFENMTGSPFQFALKQVRNILPGSLSSEESLASLSISLSFTVTGEGKIRNVVLLSSNAPAKLNRLMKDVMHKTRFRPALVDGQPEIAHNVTITQSFPLINSGRR